MGRCKNRVGLSREHGLPNKRDTPVKPTLNRGKKSRRFLPSSRYESVPEEPEETSDPSVKPALPVMIRLKPVLCKSVLSVSRPALTENSRDKAVPHAATAKKKSSSRQPPAGHTSTWTPGPQDREGDGKPVKGKDQNMTLTLESITSSSTESDTTFSSGVEDDDDEDCYSTSSSLPSPEIFRRENYVETQTFHVDEELPRLQLHIRNSTLLDVSHAENIHMFLPPNLSDIMDASTILVEKNFEINKNRRPEAGTKTHVNPFKPKKEQHTPPKPSSRRPTYKKKVWFQSPVTAECSEAKHTQLTNSNNREQIQSNTDTSRVKTSPLTVSVKIPVKSSLVKAKFFDFLSDSDRDAFFERMRERCVKLRSAPVFPLTAPKFTEPSVL